ncbi:MAG: hypothetical protein HZC55_00820 [Verrucomicrobia bacterium]|nr:hypothetical protein [Verrucomicrobiota bacterium]
MKTNNPNHPDPFFAESPDACTAARLIANAVLARLLIWQADAPSLEDRGLRTTVALYCVRPDLIAAATLEEIGDRTGRTKQWVHALADSFRLTTGIS